ncbi:hypothetical protein D3C80_1912110 [compost metagenome]
MASMSNDLLSRFKLLKREVTVLKSDSKAVLPLVKTPKTPYRSISEESPVGLASKGSNLKQLLFLDTRTFEKVRGKLVASKCE